MGHRLTIAMTTWRAGVRWTDDEPAEADLAVEVEFARGAAGQGWADATVTAQKTLARSNAVRLLDADRFPQICFQASDIEKSGDGYRLLGTLEIHGVTRECAIDLHVEDLGDAWRMSCRADVRQSEFGIKPYSMLMGSMKVVDTVAVSFSADRAKDR